MPKGNQQQNIVDIHSSSPINNPWTSSPQFNGNNMRTVRSLSARSINDNVQPSFQKQNT
jgi:hypothetical protein